MTDRTGLYIVVGIVALATLHACNEGDRNKRKIRDLDRRIDELERKSSSLESNAPYQISFPTYKLPYSIETRFG